MAPLECHLQPGPQCLLDLQRLHYPESAVCLKQRRGCSDTLHAGCVWSQPSSPPVAGGFQTRSMHCQAVVAEGVVELLPASSSQAVACSAE
eukprot:2391075-Amphidinium_carterae.1